MNKIILDALFGAVLLGGLSYFLTVYKNNYNYIKIMAFLWAAPATYFYLVSIIVRENRELLTGFNIHALLGILLTTINILITCYFINLDNKYLIGINLFYFLFVFFVYFYFKTYKLI